MGISQLNIYAPAHLAFLGFFTALNFYMHCGYTISWLERALSSVGLDGSEFHNLHHSCR